MSGSNEEIMYMKMGIFVLLLIGFLLLFHRLHLFRFCSRWLQQTRQYMDESARKRLLDNRQMLMELQTRHTMWFKLEQLLHYSGLYRWIPKLTVENWIAANIVVLSAVFWLFCALKNAGAGIVAAGGCLLFESGVVMLGRQRAMRSVNDNLMKFLDFLGNYSITEGELTGIFRQVSRYVDEPLKSALVECYYEAQTTGDTAMALLAMAEKVEHPAFKELVRNLEISMRYSADFTILVHNSRRSVREYLRSGSERGSLLREALINMLLLVGLSVFIFLTVDGLIDASIWHILFATIPGRIALGVLGVIFLLFGRKIYQVYR